VLFVRGNSKTIKSLLQDENSRQIQADLDQNAIKRAKSTVVSMLEVTELDVNDGDGIAHVIFSPSQRPNVG
jgi:hypothetical protein